MRAHTAESSSVGMMTTIILLLVALPVIAREEAPSQRFGHQDVPISQLSKEHDITIKIADAAIKAARRLHSGEDVNRQRLIDMHDFFVNFVDACHHAKEEKYYFPVALVADPDLRPIVQTLELHHDIGKSLLAGVDRALVIWEQDPQTARREAADNLIAYTDLLERHINLESTQFMQPAEAALTPEQKAVVREGFHYVESEELGEGFHEKYHALAMKILEDEYR